MCRINDYFRVFYTFYIASSVISVVILVNLCWCCSHFKARYGITRLRLKTIIIAFTTLVMHPSEPFHNITVFTALVRQPFKPNQNTHTSSVATQAIKSLNFSIPIPARQKPHKRAVNFSKLCDIAYFFFLQQIFVIINNK